MPTPMMACGHAANATSNDRPVCVICYGVHPGATVVDQGPDLTGRMARCCGRPPVASSPELAFFQHRPEAEYDSYYCGCRGWD